MQIADFGSALSDVVVHFGYGAVFVLVFLESASVPLPGETALVTARTDNDLPMVVSPIRLAVSFSLAALPRFYEHMRRYSQGLSTFRAASFSFGMQAVELSGPRFLASVVTCSVTPLN